jgi:amidase
VKRITRDQITNVFGANQPPVADVEPGETILFETLDAAGGRVRTVEDGLTVLLRRDLGNPATGPVRVVGARPGDTLAVTILDIRLGAQGYSRFRAGGGVITAELKPPFAKIIPVSGGVVHFSERLRFPARPMVGVIGTAPAGAPVHSYYPGPHGGNLDVNAIAVGATVYLPVGVPGALLAIGDVHAHMGDGELTGGGIDIPAEVTVRVGLRKGLGWTRPVVETATAWCACANAPTLPEAIRLATSDMATLLAQALGMSREEAFVLIGCAGDARIGQAAELGMDATAYVQVGKAVLPRLLES